MVEDVKHIQDLSDDLMGLSQLDSQELNRQLQKIDNVEFLENFLLDTDISHLHKPPTLEEIEETQYRFEVNLPGEHSGKNTWVYSTELKKVFIKMQKGMIL